MACNPSTPRRVRITHACSRDAPPRGAALGDLTTDDPTYLSMLGVLQKLRSSIALLIALTSGSIAAIAFFYGKAPWFFIVAVSVASVLTVLAGKTGLQDYQLLYKPGKKPKRDS
jgi:hypothetical protein